MAKSPAHYRAALNLETTSKQRGSGVHSVILGEGRVVAYPGAVRRGKEYEAFVAAHPGYEVLTRGDYERVMGMVDALRANDEAMALLTGQHEVELDWSYLGRACQSHVDVIGDGRAFITELKTAVTAEPWRFGRQALQFGYHAQLAFYREALMASGARTAPEAFVVAIESSAPYPVTILKLTDRALDFGARLFRLWFERLLACEAADAWPGYVQTTVPLDVPEDLELTYGSEESVPGDGEVL
jgi:exodeoxyribonuclease VIII